MISMPNEIETIGPRHRSGSPLRRYVQDHSEATVQRAEVPVPSGRMVVAAPMSFAGSSQRIWKITARGRSGWATARLVTVALLAVLVVWSAVLCWYLVFGLLLVPYRIVRRGQRKQRLAQRRHDEMLAAVTRGQLRP
jgi:hypothetical protein